MILSKIWTSVILLINRAKYPNVGIPVISTPLTIYVVKYIFTSSINRFIRQDHDVKSLLTVPDIEKKRSINTLRKKLPKALSGKDALRMLKDKEEEKKANEIAKQKRKEERLFKKAQKEEEKERKRIAREENKLKRKQKQLEKAQSKKQKYRKESNESDDSEEEAILKLVDSSKEEFEETLTCPGCNSDEGTVDEWIRCQACSRKWHITCTGDAVIFEIPTEQIEHYPFHCEFCI